MQGSCRFAWGWRPYDIAFVGLALDLGSWGATTGALSEAPEGAAIYLLGTGDLRRGIARGCSLVDGTNEAAPARHLAVPPRGRWTTAPGRTERQAGR